ncbi:MAG: DUF4037 domain-containing protein [Sphaerochaeta sp.]|nr:DUF4037 domain-containing protein [Sphaerochaeta sp.]
MKGLRLSELFFEQSVCPAFAEELPHQEFQRLAFGLVGPGSECYGFDDELSRDHDWGPRVIVWVPSTTSKDAIARYQAIYDGLDPYCFGYGHSQKVDSSIIRQGVHPIDGFFSSVLGYDHPPATELEWMVVKEEALSLATNGKVFSDGPGLVTAFRTTLMEYYPTDVWLKKISSRCALIAQYGQSNLLRSYARKDDLGVCYELAMVAREAAMLVYLLKEQYRPYYKWLFLGLEGLGDLGCSVREQLEELFAVRSMRERVEIIEVLVVCLQNAIATVLDLTPSTSCMLSLAEQIQKRIKSDFLQGYPGLLE